MYKYCLKCLSPLKEDGVCQACGYDNYSYDRAIHHLKPETVLHGRYYVGAELGEGGFGITYVGLDLVLNRKIAIKEFFPNGGVWRGEDEITVKCHTTLLNQQNFELGKQKCISEAQSLAKLDDISAVVRILDFFSENNTAYIIMEFVEGSTLKDYVRSLPRKMTLREALDLLKPITDALEIIHKRGFVHRDISPDNIMLVKNGTSKLLDFGAVKSVTPDGSATEHPVIKQGFSPLEMYSSNGLIGPWTDVYALAATILYLIMGIFPDDPPNRLDNDTFPEKLDKRMSPKQKDVFLKALSIQSKNRYQSVGDFIYDLRETLNLSDFQNHYEKIHTVQGFSKEQSSTTVPDSQIDNQSAMAENVTESIKDTNRSLKKLVFRKKLKQSFIVLLSVVSVYLFIAAVVGLFNSMA